MSQPPCQKYKMEVKGAISEENPGLSFIAARKQKLQLKSMIIMYASVSLMKY